MHQLPVDIQQRCPIRLCAHNMRIPDLIEEGLTRHILLLIN